MSNLFCWRDETYGGDLEETPTSRDHVKNGDVPADSTKALV